MGTATFVRNLDGWRGDARLYRCEPPMQYGHDEEPKPAEYVIVSGVFAMFSGPETYIFPATADGEVADWGELDGSFQGGINHEEALSGAGYEIAAEAH